MKKIMIVLTLLLLNGCRSALLYTTNSIPVPLIQNQGETQISGQYGTNGKSFNLVSSPLKNISVSIAGNYDNVTKKSEISEKDLEDKNSHKYTEVAVGYSDFLSETFIGETFAGYGRGEAKDQYFEQYAFSSKIHENLAEGKYEKYFIQGNLGQRKSDFATGFALRLSYVSFFELMKIKDGVNSFPSSKEFLIFEPAIFAKIGGKNLKLEVEVIFPYTAKDIDFDYQSLVISAGLRFIF
ncbi:MAG: hypothetical protein M0Q21_07310 [Ignavibacteriaceae bacterium]|nr:hypothetical protein [Ignavibacteriaceae bacterium]